VAQVAQLLNADGVGEILGKHPRTVLRLARDGELPVVRLGYKSVRFRPQDVQEFIDRHVVVGGRR
jgi:excisionase family DNA binding protein